MKLIGDILVIIGSIFLLLGGLGVLRMPDTFNRLQAGTKATTLGAMSVLLGIGFWHLNWMGKIIIFILFIVFTNPISSHILIRTTYLIGNRDNLKVDENEEKK